MNKAKAYAAHKPTEPLAPFECERRDVGASDVQFDIKYCGVCHSDLHTARGEWPGTIFPVVPGHEIVGVVTKVGSAVSNFKVGDFAAVGCLVDSCRECSSCQDRLEQYCDNGQMVFTYNSPDKHFADKPTYGGYSTQIVVDQSFCFKIAPNLDLAASAPLLCAGITTYSPLKHWSVGKNSKVAIVGLGGLGHMALKFSHALGAETVLFTTSQGKSDDAKRFGADEVVISKDETEVKRHTGRFDFILNTVAASHDLNLYTSLLKRDGTMCLVGVPEHPHPSPDVGTLIRGRKSIAGSLIGGTKETQEMLEFCSKHGITSDIEIIKMQDIDKAYDRMLRSDVRYRFVIDMASLR